MRELKRNPSGHYTRSQWVLCGICPGRRATDQAFWTQPLWEFGEPTVQEGFSSRSRAADAMVTARVQQCNSITEFIVGKMKERENFEIGGTVRVEFVRDRATGHIHQLKVSRDGVAPKVLDGEFAQSWEEGDMLAMAIDLMMEVAATPPETVEENRKLVLVGAIQAIFAEPLSPEQAEVLLDFLGPQKCEELITLLQTFAEPLPAELSPQKCEELITLLQTLGDPLSPAEADEILDFLGPQRCEQMLTLLQTRARLRSEGKLVNQSGK